MCFPYLVPLVSAGPGSRINTRPVKSANYRRGDSKKAMRMKVDTRLTVKSDIDGLKAVLNSTNLFPAEHLEEMIAGYLDNPDSEDIWVTCSHEAKVIGFGYCAPEQFTDGTYNLLAIAVLQEVQGKGIGKKIMHYVEQLLKDKGSRLLIVDTSSDNEYTLTQKFYEDLGYRKEAIIHDFWKEGEDKIVYWKRVS